MPERRTSRTTLERRGRLVFGLFILLTVVACLSYPFLQMGHLARSRDVKRAQSLAWAYEHRQHILRRAADPDQTARDFAALSHQDARPTVIVLEDAPPGTSQQAPANLTEFQADAVANFLEHPEESRYHRESDDELRYAQAFRIQGTCVDCHQEYAPRDPETGQPVGPGQIKGVASLTLDVSRRNETLLVNQLILGLAAVVVVAVSVALFNAMFRTMVVRPIQHLKDVADRVSEGDLQVRSEIDTGNELAALSDAMNHMLDEMLDAQADLRQANEVRDAKLDELAKANVALFEMNQVKNKFLATMSHELRTPLNSILGFAQILGESEDVAEDPKLDRYVQNIQTSGRMLLEMINDLLDLAKIEAGRVQVRCEKISPQDIAEVACNMVRPMIGDRDLELSVELDEKTPVMVTDGTKVQQILYNLLSNAIKFTGDGWVRLTITPTEGEQVAFHVSDTGPGIAREQQLRIFERFTQLDSSYTRRYRGTGLGLSIVKELTNLLGGTVAVESTLGEGSTFTVVLPVDSSEAEGRTPEDQPGLTPPEAEPDAGNAEDP